MHSKGHRSGATEAGPAGRQEGLEQATGAGRTVWKAVQEAGYVELRGGGRGRDTEAPPAIPFTILLGFGYTDFEVLLEQIITSKCDRYMGQGTEV